MNWWILCLYTNHMNSTDCGDVMKTLYIKSHADSRLQRLQNTGSHRHGLAACRGCDKGVRQTNQPRRPAGTPSGALAWPPCDQGGGRDFRMQQHRHCRRQSGMGGGFMRHAWSISPIAIPEKTCHTAWGWNHTEYMHNG